MKSHFVKILFIVFFSLSANGNEIKKGWNFGIFPVLAYDADLGFDYGIVGNIYHFGDGSRYPQYNHSIYFVASQYTKGSGVYRIFHDTDVIVPGIQISTDLTYIPDKLYDFFGFNGYESVFNYNWIDDSHPDYRSRAFYKYDRQFYRFKTDWQGSFSNENFKWVVGLRYLNIAINEVNVGNLNTDLSDSEKLPVLDSVPGLYRLYSQWGLLDDEEFDGGSISTFKLGLVYDTRDFRQNPKEGMWTEFVLELSPEFLGSERSFGKYSFIHRQYYEPFKGVVFAGRFQYQGTLFGDVPFYAQPFVSTSVLSGFNSEGLGGSRTLRGIVRNRIVGDDFFFVNLESRFTFYKFVLFKQNFDIGANVFTDLGMVTRHMRLNRSINDLRNEIGQEEFDNYFSPGSETIHPSYGFGIKGIMNDNFILSIDYGIALDDRDGRSGFYVLMNYLF